MGKKRNSHLTNINKLMIPSADESREMYSSYYNNKDNIWKIIHNRLANLITEAAKCGLSYVVLHRDNFFDYNWYGPRGHRIFVNEFVPLLENFYKYVVKKRDDNYYIIYWNYTENE